MDKKIFETMDSWSNLQEVVPLTKGRVNIALGTVTSRQTTIQDLPCLALNDLRLMSFKASFIFVSPGLTKALKSGGSCKGLISFSLQAQQEEFTEEESGTAETATYFFGKEKPQRTLDIFQRLFEKGYTIKDVKGLKSIKPTQVLDITVEGKNKVRGSSIINFKARLRVK